MSEPGRIAVVDLGTNSTRLLVAEVGEAGDVKTLERCSGVTRLGDGVDASGRLSDAAMQRVYDRLAEYREIADAHDAATRVAVATSAVRDAENGADLQRTAKKRFGFDVETISGDEEARLTFLGATAGRRQDGAPTLVIDVGGGSTELVVGRPGGAPDFHVSTQLGSVRQSERHLTADPPTAEQLRALCTAARQIVAGSVPAAQRRAVSRGIAVAGTATSLAAVDTGLEPYDHSNIDGTRLALDACEEMLERLASLPLDERRQVRGLHPDRAETIVAGAAILITAMRAFGLGEVEVTQADVMHGAAISALRARQEVR